MFSLNSFHKAIRDEATVYLSNGGQSIKFTGKEWARTHADQGKTEQVVINFVNNALKYAPDSEIIEINVQDNEDYIEVKVVDQGKGIPEYKLKFLFNIIIRRIPRVADIQEWV